MSEETPIETPAGEETPVKFDARLAEGVAYFEQMLEIMPDDRTTLEFLVVAYDMLGQHEKGQKALVSLAELLVKEHDLEALKGLLPRLEASDYAPAKALFLKVSTLTAPTPDLTPERPKELTESEKTEIAAQEAVQTEKMLLHFLKEAGILSDADYDLFSSHLVAPNVGGRVFLISALHILKNENASLYEKSVEYLADHFGGVRAAGVVFQELFRVGSASSGRGAVRAAWQPVAHCGGESGGFGAQERLGGGGSVPSLSGGSNGDRGCA